MNKPIVTQDHNCALEELTKVELLALIRRMWPSVSTCEIRAVRLESLWAKYEAARDHATSAMDAAHQAADAFYKARTIPAMERWQKAERAFDRATAAQENAFAAWELAATPTQAG